MHRRRQNKRSFIKWMLITLAVSVFIYLNNKDFTMENLRAITPWLLALSIVVGIIRVLTGNLLMKIKKKKESKIKIDMPSYHKKVFTF